MLNASRSLVIEPEPALRWIIDEPSELQSTGHQLHDWRRLGGTSIPVSDSVRSLGVILDSTVSFDRHVVNFCKALSTLSHKSATFAVFLAVFGDSRGVAVFCDSLTFVRQPHFSATVWTGLKAAFHHTRALRRIRKFILIADSKSIAAAVVGSRFDYCNSLQYGLS